MTDNRAVADALLVMADQCVAEFLHVHVDQDRVDQAQRTLDRWIKHGMSTDTVHHPVDHQMTVDDIVDRHRDLLAGYDTWTP
jgi:putative NIF3 family GTP cyclohydrolase 1 type 2